MRNSILLSFLLLSFFSLKAQQNLKPVQEKSKLTFKINNFGLPVDGSIAGMDGTIAWDKKNTKKSSFNVSTKVVTINTDNTKRDNHLKNADFFDEPKFPTITLKSTAIFFLKKTKEFVFEGTLTIKNVTKPVKFTFTADPVAEGYNFKGNFAINRLDYGIGTSSATMGDDVKVSLDVFAK